MMIDMGLCLASNLNPQVVHNGVLPLLCSAALFIRAGICPVQCPDTCVSVKPSLCLSLGAEPSRSRSPWVKLNRFSSAPPQSGVLAIVRSTVDVGATKKPLSTAPGGEPPERGQKHEITAFICRSPQQRVAMYQGLVGTVKTTQATRL